MSIEWVDWNSSMRILRAAEVGSMPWTVLAGWCGEGLIEAKAATLTGYGEVVEDAPIPPELWTACKRGGGARLDAMGGSIRCRSVDPRTKKQTSITIIGTSFRKDQLLAQVPHLRPDQVNAALSLGGNWLGGEDAVKLERPQTPPPAHGKGGAKTDRAGWDAFWMAVVELAAQERLTTAHFDNQKELSAEILAMCNDALAPRTIKGHVSQIWNRWVEPTR